MYILTAVLRRRNGASFSFLSLFFFFSFSCLFVFFPFLLFAFPRFILLLRFFFWFIRIFSIRLLLSSFFRPHPPSAGIRSAFNDSQNSRAAEPLCNERNTQPYDI